MMTEYRFYDYATMKPGQLLMGLSVGSRGIHLAPSWEFELKPVHDESNELEIPITVLLEGTVDFRNKLPTTYRTKTGVVFYLTNTAAYQELINDAHSTFGQDIRQVMRTMKFVVDKPIGLFLGHVVRSDGRQYINVLTGTGHDVWI